MSKEDMSLKEMNRLMIGACSTVSVVRGHIRYDQWTDKSREYMEWFVSALNDLIVSADHGLQDVAECQRRLDLPGPYEPFQFVDYTERGDNDLTVVLANAIATAVKLLYPDRDMATVNIEDSLISANEGMTKAGKPCINLSFQVLKQNKEQQS